MAYLDGGIKKVRELRKEGLAKDLADGFELIDKGSTLLDKGKTREGRRLIVEGNQKLFWHEQRKSVTPVFKKYFKALAWFSATFPDNVRAPNRQLRSHCEKPTWPYGKDASYGPLAKRWSWLQTVYQGFVTFSSKDPKGVMTQIDRAIKGRVEPEK